MRLTKQRIRIPSLPAGLSGSEVGEYLRKLSTVLSTQLGERVVAVDQDLLENNTGAVLARGDVVALDAGNQESVVQDDTAGSFKPFVVALTEPENGKQGFFSTHGITPEALVQGAVGIGEYLSKSSTAKALEGTSVTIGDTVAVPEGAVAVALASNVSGSATIPVYLLGFTQTDLPDQTVNADHVGTDWPHARVRRTTNQSIASGASPAIIFDAERWDTGGIWSAGSPTILLAPRDGLYSIGANVDWDANATGERHVQIRLNGTIIGIVTDSAAGSGPTRQIAHTQYRLSANDQITITVFQNSGGPLNVVSAANWSPEAWMSWERP